MRQRAKIILVLAAFLCFGAAAQTRIPAKELRDEIDYLCHPLLGGRAFASRGSFEVAWHLNRELCRMGFHPVIQRFAPESDSLRCGANIIVEMHAANRYVDYAPTVVVFAHYDGTGDHSGRHFPGADSNASGVAALLGIVRHINIYRSHVSFVFAFLDGHSVSMAGAKALKDYLRPRKIAAAVSLDILGASLSPLQEGRPDYLIALGGSAWSRDFLLCNEGLDLQFAYDYYGSASFTDLFYRKIGDQSVFVSDKIPSVMFTSGITMNTNKEKDTPDSLDWQVYPKRVELILRWLEMLARK